MSHVLMVITSLFFRAMAFRFVHDVAFQHKRLQIILDTIGNMTDSNNSNADTEADTDEQNDNRLPYQSVAEADTLWVCLDTLQKMTRQFEDESDDNTETINKHLRDAQIELQKAKNAQRQKLIFDRVYADSDLTLDEYEVDVDTDTYKIE